MDRATPRDRERVRLARLEQSARWTGVGVAGVGVLVLAGWALQIQTLRAVVPGLATMKPDTAAAFLVLGVALAMLAGPSGRAARTVARAAGVVVAVFTGITLLEYVLGHDLGINTWVLRLLGRGGEATTGRGGGGAQWAPLMAPSPATVTGLLCMGLGIALLKDKPPPRVRAAEVLAAIAGLIGLIAALGYAIGVRELYEFPLFFSTALHTAVCLLLMAGGILCARASGGAMSVMTSELAGGLICRRFVPLAALGPLILAGLVLRGQQAGWFGEGVAIALLGVGSAVLLVTAAMWTAASLNRTDAARRAGEVRQNLMMAELDHRVKNNLAAVLGLAELTISSSASLGTFATTFTGRVRAMARTHEALAATRWEGVRLRDLVRMTVGPMADGGSRLDIAGDNVMLPSRASSAMCAMLHELATNASKYGALSVPGGRVRVAWEVDDAQMLSLEWQESGVDGIREPTKYGFGTELIRGSVTHELQGSVQLTYRPPGLRCGIRVPLGVLGAGMMEDSLTGAGAR